MSRIIGLCGLLLLHSACIVTVANQCSDGIRDGNESDVDCGGSCAPCGPGRVCFAPADCTTSQCVNNVCAGAVQSSCTDFVRNGSETDVDCGGAACPRCGVGRLCLMSSDCASNACNNGRCIEPTFTPAPTADVFRIQGGAGVTVQPGTLAGYGITAAATGSSFRLVWTGDGTASGQYREFYGSVSTDGTITSVTPGCGGMCQLNNGDYVSTAYTATGGQRVDFDAFNVNNLDGFDFTVAGGASGIGEPVYFDLYIDGRHQPGLVFFTDANGQQNTPPVIPFGLTTR